MTVVGLNAAGVLATTLHGNAVGLCVTDLGGGGTERHCELVAQGLREFGIRVVLFVEKAKPAGYANLSCFDRIVYDAVGVHGRKNDGWNEVAIFHLNVWQNEAQWVARVRETGRPYVATLHTSVPVPIHVAMRRPWRIGSLVNSFWWTRQVRRLGCPIIAISEWNLRRIERALPSIACQLIYNGIPDPLMVETKRQSGPPHMIAWIGSLTARKRPLLALDVAKQLGADYRIVFAGAGPEHDRCLAHAHRHHISNVEFVGHISDPLSLLRRANALLVTSKWEGIPYVAVEAMALDRFVFATPCGALDALLKTTGAGQTCAPDAAKIAERIRGQMAINSRNTPDAGRRVFEQLFDYDQFILKIIGCYSGLLQTSSAGAA